MSFNVAAVLETRIKEYASRQDKRGQGVRIVAKKYLEMQKLWKDKKEDKKWMAHLARVSRVLFFLVEAKFIDTKNETTLCLIEKDGSVKEYIRDKNSANPLYRLDVYTAMRPDD